MKNIRIITIVLFILSSLSFLNIKNSFADQAGYLGIYVQELSNPMKIALNTDYGLLVTEVAEDSPAEHGGIKQGDIILKINKEEIKDYSDLRNIVRDNPDKEIKIEIMSAGKKKTVNIKLAQKKDYFYKWKWEGESFPHGDTEKMIIPFNVNPFSNEEIEKMKKQMEDLRQQIENLYKDLGKEYKKKDKDKKPGNKKDHESPGKKSDFYDQFHGRFLPSEEI